MKRYSYRAYPNGTQARQLARVFGSCRVVYNDAIEFREAAHREGRKVTRGMVSNNLTESKNRPEREWLREVSSVALQQAIADADRAYANFFGSVAGRRKGPRVGHPRFRRKSSR